jgi:Tfp pilus assembly protein PilX
MWSGDRSRRLRLRELLDSASLAFGVGTRRPMRPKTDERGIALVIALGVMLALAIAATAAITYTSTQAQTANYGKSRQVAYRLAEAGINEAASVLNLPANNALNSTLLSQRTSTYAGGTVTWSGTLDQTTSTWTITSTGQAANPTGGGGTALTKTLTANVTITPNLTQPLNNQAWNYIYNWGTGNTCDMTVQQSVNLAAPLYVDGNLCLQNTATITKGPLVVKGSVTLSQSANTIGTSASPISEAHIGGSCTYKNNATHNPCQWSTDNVFATIHDSTPPAISPPSIDWDGWYANANPGPKYPCYAPMSSASSTWPVFDNDTTRNDSVPTAFNLTPSTSYDCWTDSGELGWNASTKVLTVRGVTFIDGSVYSNNGSLNSYTGQGTLYVSGSFSMSTNTMLCALVSGSSCDTTTWNPNTRLFVVVANGNGDNGVSTGDSVQLSAGNNGGWFQGGIYATNTIDIRSGFQVDGPLVAKTVSLGQSVSSSFPFISVVPQGTPGNPNTYAQPNPPSGYSG